MTRSRPLNLVAGASAVALIALVAAGCGGDDDDTTAANVPATTTASSAQPVSAGGGTATVDMADNGDLGQILVDSQGNTLYLFQKDSGTTSECFGACASAWPPLRASGKPTVGSGVDASLIGTTNRSDGKPQVTYNGHPLYLFSGDQSPGDATGEGSTAFGGGWFALNASGDQVTGAASSSSSTASGSSAAPSSSTTTTSSGGSFGY